VRGYQIRPDGSPTVDLGGAQLLDLGVSALAVGRDACITVNDGLNYAPDLCNNKAQSEQGPDFGAKILISAPAERDERVRRDACRLSPAVLATRRELPVLVIHAVSEPDMPSLLIFFGQEPDGHWHARKRLNALAARMDDHHFEAV
jgi:hypothetical protein